MSETELLNSLREAVILGDIEGAERLARQVVSEGVSPLRAFDEGLWQGITEVGDGFACGDYLAVGGSRVTMRSAKAATQSFRAYPPET